MRIEDMMKTDVIRIGPDTPFDDLLCRQADGGSRQTYVVDPEDKLLGVITTYDLLGRMLPFYVDSTLARAVADHEAVFREAYAEQRGKTASEVMTTNFIALKVGGQVLEADALIRERRHNALPVVDAQGHLVGEVTRRDILRYLRKLCGAGRA